MKASELIEKLQELIGKEGDKEILMDTTSRYLTVNSVEVGGYQYILSNDTLK